MFLVRPIQNFTKFRFFRDATIFFTVFIVTLSQVPAHAAGNSLKVTYRVPADTSELEDSSMMYSVTHLVGSSAASVERRKLQAVAKLSSTKSKLISACKLDGSYYARLKVTDARGGTAGLSYLKTATVTEIIVESNVVDLPDYTEEEAAFLEEEYYEYSDYPDYIEDGYVYYSIEATCLFSGTVSLISSNAYRIYINGGAGPEYSRAELIKKKWSIILEDV
jgi:hypothetical protein